MNPLVKRFLIRFADVECLRVWLPFQITHICCSPYVSILSMKSFHISIRSKENPFIIIFCGRRNAGLIRNHCVHSLADHGQLWLLVKLSICTRLLLSIKKMCVICCVMRTYCKKNINKMKLDRTWNMELVSNWRRLTFWHIIENWENFSRKFDVFRSKLCTIRNPKWVNRVRNNFFFFSFFYFCSSC